MSLRHRFLPALVSLAALAGGCVSISLNWAMERLNQSYVRLFYAVETGEPLEVREAAWEVIDTLGEPSIAGHSAEREYQDALAETARTAERMAWEAGRPSRDALLALRSRLSQSCQSCHERYRN